MLEAEMKAADVEEKAVNGRAVLEKVETEKLAKAGANANVTPIRPILAHPADEAEPVELGEMKKNISKP